MVVSIVGFFVVFLFLLFSGMSRWSGRSMSLLDPTYASKFIPIIASVSEHQATTWTSYFFDLHFLMVLMPVGFFFCCLGQSEQPNYGKIFMALYGVLAIYFSCVMIRLMLVLAPAACVLAAVGASELLQRFSKTIREYFTKVPSGPSNLVSRPRNTLCRTSRRSGRSFWRRFASTS
jgi:dolichyl-diphosphooligosaccharide--protein glycosyltransferase